MKREEKTIIDVVDAACEWWWGLRPTYYTELEHINNPTINTNTLREKKLANKVSEFYKIKNAIGL